AKGPIEVATIGDGIDMRADEDRLEGAVSFFESAADVPPRLGARVKPPLAEKIEREGSSGEIRVGVRDAIDSGGRAADGVELREPSVEAGAVHPKWCLLRTDREGCAWRRAQKWDRGERGRAAEKRATLHVIDRRERKRYRIFFAGLSRPNWCSTSPVVLPVASRVKLTCRSASFIKKSVVPSGQRRT